MEWNFQRLSGGTWQPPLVGSFFADAGLCGVSGNGGLLRFHDDRSGPVSQRFVDSAFGSRGVHADVFAFDWRARQFALSDSFGVNGSYTTKGGVPMIVTLDPFDMVIEPWGLTIDKFEHALSVPLVEDSFRPTLFAEWLTAKAIDSLTLQDCAGATVPGFYGGEVAVGNLEHNDVDVYLTFTDQLWKHAQHQQPGDPAPYVRLRP